MPRLGPLWIIFLLWAWGVIFLWKLTKKSMPIHRGFASWRPRHARPSQSIERKEILADSDGDLLWFIQVSDIHINKFGTGGGALNLEHFLAYTIPIVRPHFVIATGDLTDAKHHKGYRSGQFKEEWETYSRLLKKHDIGKDFWIDLRGNHDCFDVPSWESQQNFFRSYSNLGRSATSQIFTTGSRKIGLVTIDGCPDLGLSRPFNFFGSLSTHKMDELQEHLYGLRSANASHVILASHYPIVTMQFAATSDGSNIQELTHNVTAYLSGHLHRLIHGAGDQLYAHRENGMLDLELGDLKDHAFFRIAAFDQGLFTFADMPITGTPYIVILNPKDSRFNLPHLEDTQSLSRSTHLRVLIFGDAKDIDASAIIDARPHCKLTPVKEGSPLYVCPWDPEKLDKDVIHSLEIMASVPTGRSSHSRISFRPDGRISPIESIGEKLMMLPLDIIMSMIFWGAYCALLSLLLLPAWIRYYYSRTDRWRRIKMSWLVDRGECQGHRGRNSSSIATKMAHTPWILLISMPFIVLAEHHYIWTFFFLLTLYLPIGPWLCGWLCPSFRSMVFLSLWGVWTEEGGWGARMDSLLFCTINLITQLLPSLCLTAWVLYLCQRPSRIFKVWGFWASLALWLLLCLFQQHRLIESYGWSMLFFGLVPSWNLIGTCGIILHTVIIGTI